MKYPKYVQVTPDAPDAWYDQKAKMWFRKSSGIIKLEEGIDSSNIMRYLKLNCLMDATPLVKKEKATESEKFMGKTPAQLLIVDESLRIAIEEEEAKKLECPYCGKKYVPKGLPNHMKFCKKNPENIN